MKKFDNQTRWRKENPLKRSIITAFAKARARAAKKGVPFDIPRGTTRVLFDRCEGRCELSGIEFKPSETGVCSVYSPSLDRIDPSKGYVLGNIRLILHGLNAMKGEGTDEQLIEICRAISRRQGRVKNPSFLKDPLRGEIIKANTQEGTTDQ